MEKLPHSKGAHISSSPQSRICGDDKNYLFGKTTYLPGGRCGPRIQDNFQLVILTGGSLQVTVRDTTRELVPGEAILQHPGIREFYRFSLDKKTTHSWCQISPRLLSPTDRKILLRVRHIAPAPSSIHLLIEEGLAIQNHGNKILDHAMAALARSCLLRFAAHAIDLDQRKTSAPIHPALERALDVAAVHYAELHSADDLAQRAGISTSRLNTLCREYKGETPSAMIWRLKLEHAIQLIRSTGLTLSEISDHCGYANPFHLSRSVRRHTGHPPRNLRAAE